MGDDTMQDEYTPEYVDWNDQPDIDRLCERAQRIDLAWDGTPEDSGFAEVASGWLSPDGKRYFVAPLLFPEGLRDDPDLVQAMLAGQDRKAALAESGEAMGKVASLIDIQVLPRLAQSSQLLVEAASAIDDKSPGADWRAHSTCFHVLEDIDRIREMLDVVAWQLEAEMERMEFQDLAANWFMFHCDYFEPGHGGSPLPPKGDPFAWFDAEQPEPWAHEARFREQLSKKAARRIFGDAGR